MAPVFASADIAALVASFSPPLPTRNHPSLIRSLSGTALLKSNTVLVRFQDLLANEPRRIAREDLPSRLGIANVDWLFECCDEPICYGRDGRSIVPQRLVQEILTDLKNRAGEGFVDSSSYAYEKDVAQASMEFLLGQKAEVYDLRRVSSSVGEEPMYVIIPSRLQSLINDITTAVSTADHEKVHLSTLFPNVPRDMLRDLVKEALESSKEANGVLEMGHDSDVFVPSSYHDKEAESRQTAREETLRELLLQLKSDGFCDLRPALTKSYFEASMLESELRMRIDGDKNDSELLRLKDGQGVTTAIVLVPTFQELMSALQAAITAVARNLDRTDASLILESRLDIISNVQKPNLAGLLLDSPEHLEGLEASLVTLASEREKAAHQQFADHCRNELLVPLHLYGVGLESVKDDATLREHLDEYLGEHFRREVVPSLVVTAKQQNLLRDKTRARETDKLSQKCAEAKVLSDLQSTVSKFTRKLKIEALNRDSVREHRLRALRQKVKAAKKMTRGSDILQNLIWILLARQLGDGLFLSSGKDTTRMIKLFRALGGDDGMAADLERWRDGLKAGQQDEAVKNMRQIAKNLEGDMAEAG